MMLIRKKIISHLQISFLSKKKNKTKQQQQQQKTKQQQQQQQNILHENDSNSLFIFFSKYLNNQVCGNMAIIDMISYSVHWQ